MFLPRLVLALHHPALGYPLGQFEAAVGLAREDLVGLAVEQAHHGDPRFGLVVEAEDVGLEALGARGVRMLFGPGLLLLRHQHAAAAAIAVHGDALQSFLPRFQVDAAHLFHRGGAGQVDGAADGMRGVLLDHGLQSHPLVPVDFVRGGTGVRALGGVAVPARLHPIQHARVVHGELLPLVAELIGEVHPGLLISRSHLAAARVAEHVHRFDAAAGAGEQAERAGGCHGAEADVAPTVLHHARVHLGQFLLPASR
jgi:hypothetical protein